MVKVRWNKPNVFTVGEVRLFPGLNEVEENDFQEISKNPIFKAKLESGLAVAEKVEGKRTVKTIVADIKETYDIKKLRALLDDERDVVARAAKAQIDKIEQETKRVEEGDGDS